MRLNGRLRPTRRGFAVEADRVFSNCPKYLQKREAYETVADRRPGTPRHGTELTSDQAAFVAAADTFFLATAHADGADVSHRGGNPGFVHVTSPRDPTWRDYPGNSMFLTLGNLAADPRAGLLFLDRTTGRTLQLTRGPHRVRARRRAHGPLHRDGDGRHPLRAPAALVRARILTCQPGPDRLTSLCAQEVEGGGLRRLCP
jgi:predicted pyridoxine 5'-phosphate oxidase superfamily flavin-nucleotide-binding protein